MTLIKKSLPGSGGARKRRPVSVGWQRLLHEAEQQLASGQAELAAEVVERALALCPQSYACALRAADLYRRMRRWNAAFGALEQAMAFVPARRTAREMALTIALEAGDRQRILAAGQALLRQEPRHLAAHNALGAVYMQMGDVESAMRAAGALLRLDPLNPAHHFKMALLSQHKGDIAVAVEEFMQTLALEPDGPHAEAAREALEILDMHQIHQIAILAMEDMVFRAKLSRDAVEAALERGFTLSAFGNQALVELTTYNLADLPEPERPLLYN